MNIGEQSRGPVGHDGKQGHVLPQLLLPLCPVLARQSVVVRHEVHYAGERARLVHSPLAGGEHGMPAQTIRDNSI